MMLQALIGYAERQGLGGMDDAFFQPVEVHWAIPLTAEGRLAGGPISYASDDPANRQKTRRFPRPFTSVNELGQGDKSHFLCDTLERIVLLLDPKTPEKAAARRVQHGYFKKLLAEAAAACPREAPRLEALLRFLGNDAELDALRRQLIAAKARPTDNALFTFGSANLLDAEEIKEFWRVRRRGMSPGTAGEAGQDARVCVATGRLGVTLKTTDKIKGVPGGLAVGTNLISFDKDAFCSYGLEQAQNAALSAPAELKIRLALNRLIEESRKDRLVFNDTAYLHWTREAGADDSMDLFANPDEGAVRALLQAVQTGKDRQPKDETAYYAMGLSGNGARIVVRDWLESTVGDVKRHVANWFEDLAIISPDGGIVRHDFKFGALLYAMVRAGLDELPPAIATQLFHAALYGGPLPLTALAAALRRQQLETENKVNPARLALIKACLLRSPTRKPTDTMSAKLDPESKDIAYRCGQLFAIIGRLQLLALGKVGASIAERTYGGAATHPATTFGPLFTKLPAYLKKANTRFPGSGTNKQKEIESLCCAIDELHGLPKILKLEEQGRFALGYYCQLAQYRADRVAAEQAKLAEEMAGEEV